MSKELKLEAYEKELRYFEKAIASDKGIKITTQDHGHAVNLRMRLNRLRAAIRRQNTAIYHPSDPRYGVSPFDNFTISITADSNCVILTKKEAEKVETL